MCSKECVENEECRYDKKNCEFKCALAEYVSQENTTTEKSTTIVGGASSRASGLVASLAALFFIY